MHEGHTQAHYWLIIESLLVTKMKSNSRLICRFSWQKQQRGWNQAAAAWILHIVCGEKRRDWSANSNYGDVAVSIHADERWWSAHRAPVVLTAQDTRPSERDKMWAVNMSAKKTKTKHWYVTCLLADFHMRRGRGLQNTRLPELWS